LLCIFSAELARALLVYFLASHGIKKYPRINAVREMLMISNVEPTWFDRKRYSSPGTRANTKKIEVLHDKK
jgi:hypothetical protein